MEILRRGENRRGRPHNNESAEKNIKGPEGFEGMNYEQKRSPYINTDQSKNRIRGVSGNDGNVKDPWDHT